MALADEKDLKLLRERDPNFLRRLFLETNPYLVKIAFSQNAFGEKAEEVIQETWSVFFSKLDEFQGLSQIKTFIAGILINKIREQRRDSQKMIPEEDHEKMLKNSFNQRGHWIQTPADPEQLFSQLEIGSTIQECLQTLTELQRRAFTLREVEQVTTDLICSELSLSVTNLGVVLFRAKEKLRACLTRKLKVHP